MCVPCFPEVHRPTSTRPEGPPEPLSEEPMNRYVAPLGFTLAAAWVLVLFVLVSGSTH
jgi:hypothetical protein